MLHAFRNQRIGRLNSVCVSCTPAKDDSNLIAFSEHWKILLHPNQSGLGNSLIVCLRHVPKISELTQAEMADVHDVYSLLEPAIEAVFGASLVNLSCDRNWAFREINPDSLWMDRNPNPHVHWHVVPRYRQSVRFQGIDWDDPTFGEPFAWRKKEVPRGIRLAIIEAVRAKLPVEYIKESTNKRIDPTSVHAPRNSGGFSES